MPDAVMVFAAGFGTRMGDLTKDRPKPLVPVAGRPLIDHALAFVEEFDPRVTVVNAHYKASQVEAYLQNRNVRISVEAPEVLDTGGGLKAALPILDSDTVFTMNSDAVWRGPNPLHVLQDAWHDDMQALMLCVPISNVIGRDNGEIDVDAEGHAHWGTSSVYTGVHVLRTDLVSNTPEDVFSLKDIWNALEKENALHAVMYDGFWCDVGHPAGIKLAEDMLAREDV